jgi:hypothetical protein
MDHEIELPGQTIIPAPAATPVLDGRLAHARRREVCAITMSLLQTAGPALLLPLLRQVYGPAAEVDAEPGATSYVLRLPCGRSATIRPGEPPAAWSQALEAHLGASCCAVDPRVFVAHREWRRRARLWWGMEG